ncbi:MAG: M23 family metallopeptidase [Coleofasciculaceae cyanobacterium]
MKSCWFLISTLTLLLTPTLLKANADSSFFVSQGNQLITPSDSPQLKVCQAPLLSRLTRHKVAAGETVASIANKYNLIPATVLGLNPSLKSGKMPLGSEILIPPFNGIRVAVPKGSNWQDVAAAYGMRADILYELNGCQKQPQQVFVPGVSWTTQANARQDTFSGFAGYPMPATATVGLSYGWHQNPNTGQAIFHSGVDLLAKVGTPVLAVEAGTVAFAGTQGSYGNLIVINHEGGRQTRYAHLQDLSVAAGNAVKAGDKIGTVGVTGKPDVDQAHLHFEVRYFSSQGWVAQDPVPNLKAKPSAQR